MKYNLSNPIHVQRSQSLFKRLLNKETVIELREIKPRSKSQWGYLHLILTWFGMEIGLSLKESKKLYKQINPDIYPPTKKEIFGEIIVTYRSSTDLDSSELTKSIDTFRDYSSREASIYLPLPNEHRFLQEIEVQASQTNYV